MQTGMPNDWPIAQGSIGICDQWMKTHGYAENPPMLPFCERPSAYPHAGWGGEGGPVIRASPFCMAQSATAPPRGRIGWAVFVPVPYGIDHAAFVCLFYLCFIANFIRSDEHEALFVQEKDVKV